MTAALTQARVDLAQALEGNGLRIYETVPAVPSPPCAVIIPDETWAMPGRLGPSSWSIQWRLTLVMASKDNRALTLQIEQKIDDLAAAMPTGYVITRIGAPQITDIGAQGVAYTTDITVKCEWKA